MKTLILLLLPVLAWAQALNITTTSLDSSTWGTAYQDTVVATGGTAPYVFRVFNRVLPTDTYLRGDGYILGLPTDTAGGGKTFSVSVTDAAGARDVQELTLGVKDSTTLAPSAPTLAAPADGALGVGIDTLLAWNDVTGETKYHIQLDTINTFAGTLKLNDSTLAANTTSDSTKTLTNSETYYWRVRAGNTAGWSSWSSTRSFTTVAAAGGYFAVGTYTGNGTDDRGITGIGFQPDMVIIKSAAAQYAVWRTSAMTGDTSFTMTAKNAAVSNMIQSLDADGFTVGDSAQVNADGVVFHWQAWREEAGYMDVGSYWGNVTDNRDITGVGFQPDFVMVRGHKTDAYSTDWALSTSVTDSLVFSFLTGFNTSNTIQVLEADGFELGSAQYANQSGTKYYYAAFKEIADYVWEGEYTGNATDDTDISATTAQPNLVWIFARSAETHIFKSSTQTTVNCFYFTNTAEITGGISIKQFNADGWRVGTLAAVNANTVKMRYIAWKTR